MQDLKIKCVADSKCMLGEGPVWDEINQDLYWVDILGNKIFRYDLSSKTVDWWETPEHVGFIVLKKGGGLIAGLRTGLHQLELQSNNKVSGRRIDRVDENTDHIRFNDGICDSRGRIWGCTMDMNQEAPLGKYYKYNGELSRTEVDKGYVVANGPALSPDGNYLYTVETVGGAALNKGIYISELKDGATVKGKQLFINWNKHSKSTFPDGIISDAEGNLWIGEFGGNVLRCFSSHGVLKQEVELPAWNVTKAVFGGKNRDILYATTARYGASEDILEKYPETGGTYEINGIGVQGQRSACFGP